MLGRLIACGASAAVAITGIYGMATGRYTDIEIVWAVTGPLFGALLAHYLAATRKDS